MIQRPGGTPSMRLASILALARSRQVPGKSEPERHDKLVHFVALMMKLSGASARVERRNLSMVNQFRVVPLARRLLPVRDPTRGQRAQRMLQGAVPDLE
jgi:hypothetical protein